MAGGRKGERKLVIEKPDLGSLFFQTARLIYLRGCMLDAYRHASGVFVKFNQSAVASETLALEIRRCEQSFNHFGSVSDAHEHASQRAMKAYLGNWWSHTFTDIPPVAFNTGDEFFNKHTIVAIIEDYRDFRPDRKG